MKTNTHDSKSLSSKTSRRGFLRRTSATMAAFSIVPGYVLGTRGQTPPSGKLNIAAVGIGGIRFEIPSRFRHLSRIDVRYASWDLGHVYLDPRAGKVLARLYSLDRARNADGRRRSLGKIDDSPEAIPATVPQDGMAPLLRKLLEEYAATGLPPAYLPQTTSKEES